MIAIQVEKNSMYYGILTHIIELTYYKDMKFVLFKCDWLDVINPYSKGLKIDEFGFTFVNFSCKYLKD